MSKIVSVITNLGSLATSFIPPVVWAIALPFVGIMAFLKIVREMK